MDRISTGKLGEKIACEYLMKKGFDIDEKNYHTCYGEIDIIASYNDQVKFVEVKTRTNKQFGEPCDSVTPSKQNKIIKTATQYISENNLHNHEVSFDVIEVHIVNKSYQINHIENAFY